VALVVKNLPASAGDPWVRKIPWRKHGNAFLYSCLENPMRHTHLLERPDTLLALPLLAPLLGMFFFVYRGFSLSSSITMSFLSQECKDNIYKK